MPDYDFKEWLTVDEAAAWLTDNAGKPYSGPALHRVIEKGLFQAYYWPAEAVSLGVFVNKWVPETGAATLTPMRAPDGRQKGRPLTFVGPVPFSDYATFRADASGMYAGTLGILNLEERSGTINGGIYILGPNDQPLSMDSICYKVLIHIRDLETFDPTQATMPVTPPEIIVDDNYWLARCKLFPLLELHAAYIDQPLTSPPPQDLERTPTLKTLAFAAHLIANLAERLDESEPVASRKLGVKKAGKPVVSQVAAQLAKTAEALNYSGHGYGEKGFQAHLSRALKELD